jgi:hypothetical protein
MATAENRVPEGLTSSQPYVSAHGRAQVVVFLFLAYIAVSLFSIFSDLLQIRFLSGALAGGGVSEESAEMNDLRQGAVAIIQIVVYIALVVSFLLWLHRATKNVPALGNPQSHVEYTPGWAVGSFFIPLGNLFMPYRAVKEAWEKSDPAIKTEDDRVFTPAASTPLLLGWWVSWLAMLFISRVVSQLGRGATTIETMRWVTRAHVVAQVVGIVAAVLAVFVVRGLDRRQEERARHVAYVPHTPPPPPLFTPPPPPPRDV